MLLICKIDVRQTSLATTTTSPLQTNSTQPTRVASKIDTIAEITTNRSTIIAHTTLVFPFLVVVVVLILLLLQRTTATHSSCIGMVVGADYVIVAT